MNTKLTLRLDDEVIRRAKRYSRKVGKPVSRLVADYFTAVTSTRPRAAEPPPLVRSLRGALAGATVDEADHRRHLEAKHR